MADRRDEQPMEEEEEEERLLRGEVVDDEEEDGEDLLGENMMQDYQEDRELDQYDPEMLDDSEQPRMTVEQRLAAEMELDMRDGRARDQRPGPNPMEASPAATLAGSGDEADGAEGARRVRRRVAAPGDPGDEEPPEPSPSASDEDDEVPESYYDLTHERLSEGAEPVDKRLEEKIRRNFRQFLLKFTPEGQTEPKYPDMLQQMAEEHQRHLDVSFLHLQKWSPPLALWISDNPLRILPILNETLMSEAERKFQTYKQLRDTDENELRVAIHSFPVREPIRELNSKHLNKLVLVHGVATKRGNVFNQVKRLYLRCAKCSFPSGPFEAAEEKDLKPGACLECQSRGPWIVDRSKTLYRNYQKITLQESPSSVEPGKMPRSKEIILTGDQVDSIRPGDELQVTGIYRCLHDAATNARTCFPVFRTEIQSVHVHRKGDVKMFNITDEQQRQILELAKSPNIKERIIASMAPSIYGMRHVKIAIAMAMMGGNRKECSGKHRIRGDINVLIVGDPGLAKSQFLKYVEQTFPRAVYTTGKGASAVGLTAAVTKDERGEWVLEGGAMVLADDGICLIDEFDKMNDQDRTSIHEAMEQQTISISKAGIVTTLQACCAVVAVGNPTEGRYDPTRSFAQNVNLSDPILSRFDVLCVLRDESDPVKDEMLADHVVCSHMRSHPEADANDKRTQPRKQHRDNVSVEPIDQDLLQKYIIYARKHVKPQVTDIDKSKLARFYQEIRQEAFRSGGAPMTARHVDSIMRLTEASAKMELRQHCTSADLDWALSVTLESFIQSQKHQVAEELRKKFRHYTAHATPISDQIMMLLDRLFKERHAGANLQRAEGEPEIDLSDVAVSMADVVRQIESDDLDIDQVHSFMETHRFRQNFRVEGESLFRL